ncbi:hypothetical protein AB0F71_31670 [Kitasatospora sp. NPDC028055]|uniref:hypothetical protein n=1 Tax=Kitasatospora sp. NPDC028055 TaxID=3155653 RepID=UPI0033F48746
MRAGTPARPLLQEADDGPLRTDLLAALRRGARIAIWITGPAKDLTRFHSRIDRMTEEAGPAAEALATGGTSITRPASRTPTGSTSSSCHPKAAPASRAG